MGWMVPVSTAMGYWEFLSAEVCVSRGLPPAAFITWGVYLQGGLQHGICTPKAF